jgi:catechol 2,3-dioxygenase-like lactoylglutathione lyase family enzyme
VNRAEQNQCADQGLHGRETTRSAARSAPHDTLEEAMSSTQARGAGSSASARRPHVDAKLEVVVIPVSDVDRAKAFYTDLGWRLDADFADDSGFRIVQLTPPGSPCSIQLGTNVTSAAPGSVESMYLVVSDIEAARAEYLARGADVGEVFHEEALGARFGAGRRRDGHAPDHGTYGSFASFGDPDGNGWLFQEITARLPGRIDAAETSYASASDLASALLRAAAAHHEHEVRTGEEDANWSDWYADYMVREQAGDVR